MALWATGGGSMKMKEGMGQLIQPGITINLRHFKRRLRMPTKM